MDTVTLILLGVMPALAIVAGLKDLTSMKIPNWISGLLILAFFPAALAVGLDPMTVAANLGVAALALVIGAGMFLLWTGVMGGLFCLVLLFARFHSRPYLLGAPGWVVQLMEPRGDIPYGVAIAAGALMAYPASPLLAAFIAG